MERRVWCCLLWLLAGCAHPGNERTQQQLTSGDATAAGQTWEGPP